MDWRQRVRRQLAVAQLQYRLITGPGGACGGKYSPLKAAAALGLSLLLLWCALLVFSGPRAIGRARHMETPARSEVSIIVPTYKEAENIRPLCERVFSVCREAGLSAELIIVDDNSRDGTEELVAELAASFPVRLHTRRHARGLSSAVLLGFELAKYETLLVMDADLSHPPEAIPAVARPVVNGEVEFTLGSRYMEGGGTKDWPLHRRIISQGATLLARPLVAVSDPMSGFFALRRETWLRATDLNPSGFKIALELLVKTLPRGVREIPYAFVDRQRGQSKLKLKTQVQYALQVLRLYARAFPAFFFIAASIAACSAALFVAGVVRLWRDGARDGRSPQSWSAQGRSGAFRPPV